MGPTASIRCRATRGRGPSHWRRARACAAGLVALGGVFAAGTEPAAHAGQPPKPDKKLIEEGHKLFDKAPPREDAKGKDKEPTWSIVIVGFVARSETAREAQRSEAAKALERVRTVGELPEAYLEERGEAIVIAYGSYPSASDRKAQADLKKVRAIEWEGTHPFEGAVLVPPAEIQGDVPELDLRNVKKTLGKDALYTLQIGAYGREDGRPATAKEMAEFRRLAEKAAVDLRRQGEEAFYYHGPNRSMVTIGVFGPEDFGPEGGDPAKPFVQSPRLIALKERFPYNLVNGMGTRQTVIGTSPSGKPVEFKTLGSSRLVNIPDS